MLNPVAVVGFRFHPTNEELVDYYLWRKNLGDGGSSFTSDYVDEVISTVNICSFDPWDLPSQSKTEMEDLVWYFFAVKENRYNRGERQSRTTESGFWKKTGPTYDIMGKRGRNREKIGEKKVLVFKLHDGSKTKWVMHEYHHTMSLPSNHVTYTICKVSFNGEAKEMNPYSSRTEVEPSQSLIPPTNNYDGFELNGDLDLDTYVKTRDDISGDEWTSYYKTYFGYDDEELMNLLDLSNDGGPNLGQGNETD